MAEINPITSAGSTAGQQPSSASRTQPTWRQGQAGRHSTKEGTTRTNVRKAVSKDGTVIAFEQSGEGSAVILVTGALRHRALDPHMAQLSALLAEHFTVFHYDRRGRGGSGDTQPYAVEREVEDIAALINEAGGSAYVFGVSSGALLALEAAARGLAITKLAMYDPSFPAVDDKARQAWQNYRQHLPALLAEGRRGKAVALALKMFGVPAVFVAAMRLMPSWSSLESVAPTLAYDQAIMGDGSVPAERLASVAVPTLVMDGGASPAFMRSAAKAAADALPNAQRRTLEGQRHDVDPKVLAPVLAKFFKG